MLERLEVKAAAAPRLSSPPRVLDDQFIFDSEGARDFTRTQTRGCLVGLAVQDAEQGDGSALIMPIVVLLDSGRRCVMAAGVCAASLRDAATNGASKEAVSA